MINPRISADWSTTKAIAAFYCTPYPWFPRLWGVNQLSHIGNV